jgi:hypothetical protein
MMAAGEIAAAVYNVNRTQRSDHLFTARDFVPKTLQEIAAPPNPEPELDMATLKSLFGNFKII